MKRLLLFAAAIGVLFSCSKEEITPADEQKIPINISVGQSTRANDTTFAADDKVGIFVVNYTEEGAGALAASGNQVDNAKFTFDGSAWMPDAPIYWKDKSTAADFYAYYPYAESANTAAHPFSIKADQSLEEDFWASDFLWGKATNVAPSPNPISITTNHSLSRILVEVKPGEGFTDATWTAASKSIKICNVKTSATIDLSTGIATATGENGEVIPFADESGYKAMMIPQEVADNSKLIVVTVDGVNYVYRKGFTFRTNTQHKFSITVNQTDGKVDITIGEWNTDDVVNEGNAEEEAEPDTEPEATTIPNNQIWYTTTDGNPLGKSGTNISSDTYANGKGVIEFDADVEEIWKEMFSENSTLTSITLPNSVTDINDEAFSGCNNLTAIIFSNQLKTITKRAFYGCSSLEAITLPESLTRIGEYAFQNCSKLSTVKMLSTAPPTISANTFSNTSAQLKIIVPKNATNNYRNSTGWSNYDSKIVASTEN